MAKTASATAPGTSPYFAARPRSAAHKRLYADAVVPATIDDDVETMRDYPESNEARAAYVSPVTQRPVTKFQFRVYDACRQVPAGHYSTYKAIAEHLGSGPRAVGNALGRNPFCPQPIPCHRILPADCYIGGFSGDTKSKIFFKKAKLEKEGLAFDDAGFLAGSMQQSRFFGDFQ
ncbi:hypothetical protein IWQ56_004119 [Coemansia nantahalensis]|uniref:Uncharacterized protein n=2 Tax=Coemansia TaxID=4863 RepID=A0ACC1KX41_9FUNG|nr:hypothetical protein IWQ56_004119 [Coemansia nantahalensis]KAJ2765742.1 hypothetical protein IWQ57_004657 [Coemansia nantahalensis]KAJ2796230.1 hypothetical protein H4R21_004795 [Coemansia helicoidea]